MRVDADGFDQRIGVLGVFQVVGEEEDGEEALEVAFLQLVELAVVLAVLVQRLDHVLSDLLGVLQRHLPVYLVHGMPAVRVQLGLRLGQRFLSLRLRNHCFSWLRVLFLHCWAMRIHKLVLHDSPIGQRFFLAQVFAEIERRYLHYWKRRRPDWRIIDAFFRLLRDVEQDIMLYLRIEAHELPGGHS